MWGVSGLTLSKKDSHSGVCPSESMRVLSPAPVQVDGPTVPQAGVNIMVGALVPSLSAGKQFKLNYALRLVYLNASSRPDRFWNEPP